MRRIIQAVLATAPVVIASQSVFSVHDDILAFPQYEVVFSDAYISDKEVGSIIDQAASYSPSPSPDSVSKALESNLDSTSTPYAFDPRHETYELMTLDGERHLCIIPIVIIPPRNETSEAEARLAEQKELARATNRGWELLQDLEGNCLHFISGWWSYTFCYNSEVRQFHGLPLQQGKVPQPDPKSQQYVLGRAKPKTSKQDEWGNQVAVHKGNKPNPPKTELQIKGDTRYLVQIMEGGTICDLTGKPRRVEVQYHCNPQSIDRIGYVKEVTTCSYLLVVYTARLCNDVAFMPPKEIKANEIVCRVIVPEKDLEALHQLRNIEHELASSQPVDKRLNIGGVIVGEGKWANKEGARMPLPKSFGTGESVEKERFIAVVGKSKAEGGQVERVPNEELVKRDVNPRDVDGMMAKLKEISNGRTWRIEIAEDVHGIVSIYGIVDDGDEGGGENEKGENEEGSKETFKDEL